MAHEKENFDTLTKKITSVCTGLDLKVFDQKQFFEYINKLNREANEIFDYANYTSDYFKNRFGL